MKFGITARIDSSEAISVARKISLFLRERKEKGTLQPGGEIVEDLIVDRDIAPLMGWDGISLPLKEISVDVLVTVGGDGTILRALQISNNPVFGINMGALGFLTEVQPDEALQGIERILAGRYRVDERISLKTEIDGDRAPDAVNEAVIHTPQISKMRHFEIRIDSSVAERIRADGLIVATPTGSTCYAMSVGSPIVDPKANALIVVPIAPFKLSIRPLVVSAESRIEVELLGEKDATLVIDGQYMRQIGSEDQMSFTKSDRLVRFIRFSDNFYSMIQRKLSRIQIADAW